MLAFNLSAELVYTNVLNCIDLAGVPVRAADRGADAPARRRRRPLHVQPRAAGRLRRLRSCSATARRSSARSPRWSATWKAAGARRARASACCATWPRSRACTCRRCTTSAYDGADLRRGHAPLPRRARAGREAHRSPTWPTGRTRSSQLVPLTEVVHDRLNVEVFRGCTRGCRFCQAGMITRPVRERPAEQVRTMVRDGPAAHRLRRGRAHLAVDAPTSPASSGVVARHRQRPDVHAARCQRVAAEPAGRRLHRRHRRARSRRPAAPASRSRPRPARGACARSSTS